MHILKINYSCLMNITLLHLLENFCFCTEGTHTHPHLSYFSISHPGNPPTGLTLSRVSLDRVRVTWTEPDISPIGGYRIEVVSGNINMTADMSPQEITLTPRSTPYEVTLVSLSRHYPIDNIMESITLNGEALSCCCCDLLLLLYRFASTHFTINVIADCYISYHILDPTCG